MTASSTLFSRELVTTLETILTSAGYLTDLGQSVHRGFFAHVLNSKDAAFPAIVIHPGVEEVSSVHGTGEKAIVVFTVPMVMAVELSTDASGYEQLQACAYDVRKALMVNREALAQLGQRDSLEVGAVEPDILRDSRFALAAMTVSISFVETYKL